MTTYDLQYASTRAEIWRWYWRAWRRPRGLWCTHACVFVLVAFVVIAERNNFQHLSVHDIVIALSIAFGAIVWLPFYPLVMFKPQQRSLKVDDTGLDTAIGKHTAKRAWSEIKSIDDREGAVVLTVKTGNAFIVPSRAFKTQSERERFLADVLYWRAAANDQPA